MNQKQFNHYLSLVFSFILTIIDAAGLKTTANLLITIEAYIIAIVIYYIIGRVGIFIVELIIGAVKKK